MHERVKLYVVKCKVWSLILVFLLFTDLRNTDCVTWKKLSHISGKHELKWIILGKPLVKTCVFTFVYLSNILCVCWLNLDESRYCICVLGIVPDLSEFSRRWSTMQSCLQRWGEYYETFIDQRLLQSLLKALEQCHCVCL